MAKLGLFAMVVIANIVDIMPEVTYVIVPISEDVLAKIQDKVAPVSDNALQGDDASTDEPEDEGEDYAADLNIKQPRRPRQLRRRVDGEWSVWSSWGSCNT